MTQSDQSDWRGFLADLRDPATEARCIYCQNGQRCPWGCRWPNDDGSAR